VITSPGVSRSPERPFRWIGPQSVSKKGEPPHICCENEASRAKDYVGVGAISAV
jgi:hypothetical protein